MFKCFSLSHSLCLLCNFPLTPHVIWFFGWLVGLLGKLLCSYRSTCSLLSLNNVYILKYIVYQLWIGRKQGKRPIVAPLLWIFDLKWKSYNCTSPAYFFKIIVYHLLQVFFLQDATESGEETVTEKDERMVAWVHSAQETEERVFKH